MDARACSLVMNNALNSKPVPLNGTKETWRSLAAYTTTALLLNKVG
jgi:hypothetical protein